MVLNLRFITSTALVFNRVCNFPAPTLTAQASTIRGLNAARRITDPCHARHTGCCEQDHNGVSLAAQPSISSGQTLTSDGTSPAGCVLGKHATQPVSPARGRHRRVLRGGIVYALTIRNGNCRKLPYLQATGRSYFLRSAGECATDL